LRIGPKSIPLNLALLMPSRSLKIVRLSSTLAQI
jgi:hypothetical protein